MNKLDEKEINRLSPLTLAFIGDTVFDLLVRTRIVSTTSGKVSDMHKKASETVCAASQSRFVKELLPLLTEEETDIFKRGKNAHTASVPKNQSVSDYHFATGFETLLGWLYLNGKTERTAELFETIMKDEESTCDFV